MNQEKPCPYCEGSGSTVDGEWMELIAQLVCLLGESAISNKPIHPFLASQPYAPSRGQVLVKPSPRFAEISTALAGRRPDSWPDGTLRMGHDAGDRWRVADKIAKAAGLPDKWDYCPHCLGSGRETTPEERLRRVLEESRDEMIKALEASWSPRAGRKPNAGDVNCGLCSEFARLVVARVPEAEERSTEQVLVEVMRPCGRVSAHYWVFWHGKHYDAECLEGVEDWRDLPFFKGLK